MFSRNFFAKSDGGRRDEEDDDGEEEDVVPVARTRESITAGGSRGEGAARAVGGGAAGGIRVVVASRAAGGSADNAAKLPIQIRTMDGKTYKIEAKTDWDVQRLKQEFEKWHGGNAAMCSLYYKAKKLQDNNTLQSYKIGAGDFVMANYRSIGGWVIIGRVDFSYF